MKKYLLGLMAVAFAVVAFAFTNGKKVMTEDCTQNHYWFKIKPQEGCIATLTSQSQLVIDGNLFLVSENGAITQFGCSEGDCLCAVGYKTQDVDPVTKAPIAGRAPVCFVYKPE